MQSRNVLLVVVLLAAVLVGWAWTTQAASQLTAEQMKAALRTAAPEEDGFIDYVVAKVRKNELPRKLVHSTFDWARNKPRHKFQYFKRGLIVRAARRGIKL